MNRSEEEMQLLQTRHQQELNALRSQCSALMSQCSALQQKVVLQEKMQEQITNSTNRMREQLNAQLNEIDRLAPSSGILIENRHMMLGNMHFMSKLSLVWFLSGAWQPKVSSAASEISDATISDSMSSNTLAKRADMQHYVSRQVLLKERRKKLFEFHIWLHRNLFPTQVVILFCFFPTSYATRSLKVMAPRLAAPPPLKGPNKRSDPAPSRKK